MANYNSIHTGSVIDNVVSNALLKSEAASIYLTKSDAASIYLTKADASSLYPTKTGRGASGTWDINAIKDGNGNTITATYIPISALNNFSTENIFPGFNNYSSGTQTYNAATKTYTIVSAVTSSTWGSGVSIASTASAGVHVPYGYSYRFSAEVKVPSAHTITIDFNNYACSGSSWAGNDNDNGSYRTGSASGTTSGNVISIPANTWTKIFFGTKNLHASNIDQVPIYIVDGIGLNTASDSASITWYIRNPKVQIGDYVTAWTPPR